MFVRCLADVWPMFGRCLAVGSFVYGMLMLDVGLSSSCCWAQYRAVLAAAAVKAHVCDSADVWLIVVDANAAEVNLGCKI